MFLILDFIINTKRFDKLGIHDIYKWDMNETEGSKKILAFDGFWIVLFKDYFPLPVKIQKKNFVFYCITQVFFLWSVILWKLVNIINNDKRKVDFCNYYNFRVISLVPFFVVMLPHDKITQVSFEFFLWHFTRWKSCFIFTFTLLLGHLVPCTFLILREKHLFVTFLYRWRKELISSLSSLRRLFSHTDSHL